jgi:hypothetical protein
LAVLRKWIYNTSTWTVPLEYIVCRWNAHELAHTRTRMNVEKLLDQRGL